MEEDDDEDKAVVKSELLSMAEMEEEIAEIGDDDKPVVRPEQLAQIFDTGSGLALPSVKSVFEALVGLYGMKPRPAVGSA